MATAQRKLKQGSRRLDDERVQVSSFVIGNSQLVENKSKGRFERSFDLPNHNKLLGVGHSVKEAFESFCAKVSHFVYADAGSDTAGKRAQYQALVAQLKQDAEAQSVRPKLRQKSIGVYSKVSLSQRIAAGVGEEDAKFAVRARELIERGFERLDSRLDVESSKAVFDAMEARYASLPESTAKQWMLRLDRPLYERALVVAHEYGRSLSSLAALCIADALDPVE